MKNLSTENLMSMYSAIEDLVCTREVLSLSLSIIDELDNRLTTEEYKAWSIA